MSDVRDPDRDQALPIPNDRPYIQDLVLADLAERKAHGIRKYGTALQAGNGRDMLQDLYEELLDAVVYARGCIEERVTPTADPMLVEVAAKALAVAHDANACFDPLVPDPDGHVHDDEHARWESGEEDREWFRRGARAVLACAAQWPAE